MAMANRIFRFSLDVTPEQYLAYYRCVAQTISVRADDGRRVVFPAGNIRPFLTETGIQGHFEMEVTAENKFVRIRRL